jgi:hypothetical protein
MLLPLSKAIHQRYIAEANGDAPYNRHTGLACGRTVLPVASLLLTRSVG